MKKPTFSIIYNRRKDASASHASAVEVRVTAERRTIYLSTGVRLKSHEWNGSRVVRRLDADACNATLSQFSEAVAASINDLWGNAGGLSASMQNHSKSPHASNTSLPLSSLGHRASSHHGMM